MNILDAHTHLRSLNSDGKEILNSMNKAGIYGGCLFSIRPKENDPVLGADFDDRLNDVLNVVKGYEDRLFPILWVHPNEENIIEKINIAAQSGILGFKMICNNYYVYEDKCMRVLEEMAKVNKPVMFHTGILWGGSVTSNYNRPLNWEHLIEIKGLKFSMGHCSWPWYDECIALYGKFLNALVRFETAEMFLDLTPGTPEIYREDLLTKIFSAGYDFGDNLFFGTDCTSEKYSGDWAKKWLDVDTKIMDKLSIAEVYRRKIYNENLLRFLGITDVKKEHKAPVPDDADLWDPTKE